MQKRSIQVKFYTENMYVLLVSLSYRIFKFVARLPAIIVISPPLFGHIFISVK